MTELSKRMTIERRELKKILSGRQDMSLRHFMQLGQILDIDPYEFADIESKVKESPKISLAAKDDDHGGNWEPKPLGNHIQQLVQLGFALGCNMLLVCNAEQLGDSGVPPHIRQKFDKMPIRLDAEFHRYNQPQYTEATLQLRLSFDAVYTCFFPWNSIEQLTFFPVHEDTEPPKEEPNSSPPKLRLV